MLYTSNNGGATGTDTGDPVHIAEPVPGNIGNVGPDFYFGIEDVNNAQYEGSRRYLPSWHTALILQDVYGFTLNNIGSFANFYANFDPGTGELDYAHLASLIDRRTKIVCCTGASNFLGTKNRLAYVRDLASHSGYVQPDDRTGSYLLVDAAQLVPSTFVDVQQMDVDFLSFSFHKLLAPFGAGVLYGKHRLLESMRPFMYGGDMVAVGGVAPDHVDYNDLPWKFAAGTPNILGTIVSSQALRLLIDLALSPEKPRRFLDERPLRRDEIRDAMSRITDYTRVLTARAMDSLRRVPGLRIYGPSDPQRRTSLVAFNIDGCDPIALAEGLSARGVECRAGCHCATLAHRFLDLNPPASCRLSFYFYNTLDEVDRATDAVAELAGIMRADQRSIPVAVPHRRPIA